LTSERITATEGPATAKEITGTLWNAKSGTPEQVETPLTEGMLTTVGTPAVAGKPTTTELPETLETLLLQYIPCVKTTCDKTPQTNMSNARGRPANFFLSPQIAKLQIRKF
jgi:hypothetical protein